MPLFVSRQIDFLWHGHPAMFHWRVCRAKHMPDKITAEARLFLTVMVGLSIVSRRRHAGRRETPKHDHGESAALSNKRRNIDVEVSGDINIARIRYYFRPVQRHVNCLLGLELGKARR